jgi:hypothetical protein
MLRFCIGVCALVQTFTNKKIRFRIRSNFALENPVCCTLECFLRVEQERFYKLCC